MRSGSLVLCASLMAMIALAANAKCNFSDTESLANLNLGLNLKNCPDDADKLIHREDACRHFSGEITGDNASKRDKEVYDAMKKLQCGEPLYCSRKKLLKKIYCTKANL